VDKWGHHGLSCLKSAGGTFIEPHGLLCEYGKRPDGVILIPWKHGNTLVWDVTSVDTLAATHLDGCFRKSGSAALSAEKNKTQQILWH
jgi:hypothetical protein